MYHELEVEGHPPSQNDPGYLRYVVREHEFREQMEWLQSAGLRGISVSEALTGKTSGGIVITFDDGCETDLSVAAPILRKLNFGATFYITVGFLGRPGYLAADQLRELRDAGFEIGCHSMTHPYLTDLDDLQLHREIVEGNHGSRKLLVALCIISRALADDEPPFASDGPPAATAVSRPAGLRSTTLPAIPFNLHASWS
jgi:peptidoglycan/xylan/chitin deacetylase (PgdA/CDA1 family)